MIDLLLNESFVRSLFPWFAASTPVAALLLYAFGVGRRKRIPLSVNKVDSANPVDTVTPAIAAEDHPQRHDARAVLLGVAILGPLTWGMWIFYEAIMDHFGFASVKGLLIVLCVFAAVGLLAGWALRRAGRKRNSE